MNFHYIDKSKIFSDNNDGSANPGQMYGVIMANLTIAKIEKKILTLHTTVTGSFGSTTFSCGVIVNPTPRASEKK